MEHDTTSRPAQAGAERNRGVRERRWGKRTTSSHRPGAAARSADVPDDDLHRGFCIFGGRQDRRRPRDGARDGASCKDRLLGCSHPQPINGPWRPQGPLEGRSPQGTPLQRGIRSPRRAKHPTRQHQAFVADFDGFANVPVIPGHPGAPGGTPRLGRTRASARPCARLFIKKIKQKRRKKSKHILGFTGGLPGVFWFQHLSKQSLILISFPLCSAAVIFAALARSHWSAQPSATKGSHIDQKRRPASGSQDRSKPDQKPIVVRS